MLVKINNKNSQNDIINHAVQILRRGGVLVAPTETVYGLCGDATNRKTIKKIIRIKNRPQNKFFPLVVASLQQLQQYFELNKKEVELVKKYPGLSIVLKPKIGAQKRDVYLMPGQENCAVRISTNNLMRSLAKKLARPLVATSANIAGGKTCYDVRCVFESFKVPLGAHGNFDASPKGGLKLVYMILDGGVSPKNKPSTIVRVWGEEIEVLRQGEIEVSN